MRTLALGLAEQERLFSAPVPVEERLSERVALAFREHYQSVYRYVAGMLANPAVAEELTQDAFLRLLRELHRGTQIDNERAWVFRVATNLALSHKKNRTASICDLQEEVFPDMQPGPEEAVLRHETQQRLSAALERLSVQERQCFLLRSEGLRYREISEVLNIRISTVATFVTRAITKLS